MFIDWPISRPRFSHLCVIITFVYSLFSHLIGIALNKLRCFLKALDHSLTQFLVEMRLYFWVIVYLTTSIKPLSSGRVAELGDKFLDYVKKGNISPWLVMFYAPWCYHCKQMEPTFMEASTEIQKENLEVYIGKVDCTKYTSLATHFGIRGFPTVLFIDKDKVVEFNGDRTIDDIVDFTRRLSG